MGRPGNKARRKKGEMGGKRAIRKVKMSAMGQQLCLSAKYPDMLCQLPPPHINTHTATMGETHVITSGIMHFISKASVVLIN